MGTYAIWKCEVRRSERPLGKYAETKNTFCKYTLTKYLYVWALNFKSGIFLENFIAALIASFNGRSNLRCLADNMMCGVQNSHEPCHTDEIFSKVAHDIWRSSSMELDSSHLPWVQNFQVDTITYFLFVPSWTLCTTRFNIRNSYVVPAGCAHVPCMTVRFFAHITLNGRILLTRSLLRGTNWMFEHIWG